MELPEAFVFPDNLAALSTCRELGSAGVPVTVLGPRPGPGAHSRFSTYVRCPDLYGDTAAWAEAMARLAAERPTPPVLFPTEDAALLVADRYHAELSRHARYPYAAPGAASRMLDKRSLYAVAARCNVAAPRFEEVGDTPPATAAADGAWLVKPPCRYLLEGNGVRSFLAVSGGAKALGGDLERSLAAIRGAGFPAVLQENIPGPYSELVSVGLCLDREGRELCSFTARKHYEYPEPFGDGLLVERIADPGVTSEAVRLMRAFGYWGICDVEFKRDPRDGRFKLLDANPRVWLWQGLGAKSGAPMALSAYALAVGEQVESEGGENASDRPIWVSPRGVVAFLASSYRPRRHGVGLPVRLTLAALDTMLRDLFVFHDPLYLRPSAWRDILRAVAVRTGAMRAPESGKARVTD